jgi:hypothetical protein
MSALAECESQQTYINITSIDETLDEKHKGKAAPGKQNDITDNRPDSHPICGSIAVRYLNGGIFGAFVVWWLGSEQRLVLCAVSPCGHDGGKSVEDTHVL